MLSERDRQVLAGIERDLVADSPALGRRLGRLSPWRIWALPVATAATGLTLAILMIGLGLPGEAFVILVIMVWPLSRRLHRRRQVTRVRSRLRRPREGGRGTATTGV